MLRPRLPERREAGRDARAHAAELATKRRRVLVAERAPDARRGLWVLGHRVRLQARRELHAVLKPSQKEVRVRQLRRLALAHEAAHAQAAKGIERVRRPDARVAPPPDELQRLGEELDLADAAGPDLEVPRRRVARLGARAREHGRELAGHARIDGAPPDERRERLEQLGPEREVSRDRPRAQQRRALPRAPPRLVVALGRRQRVDERPARSLRPQAQVDAPDDAVARRIVERSAHEALRHAGEVLVQRLRPRRALVRLVEEQEVDVAARVELAAAELAHPDDHERARHPVGRERPAEARLAPRERLDERYLAARVGQVGQLARRDGDVLPRIGRELAGRDAQPLAARERPKAAAHGAEVGQVADRRRGEAPVRARIAAPLERAPDGRQVVGVGLEVTGDRGVRLRDARVQRDHRPPRHETK